MDNKIIKIVPIETISQEYEYITNRYPNWQLKSQHLIINNERKIDILEIIVGKKNLTLYFEIIK